jgi:hypothetical protein
MDEPIAEHMYRQSVTLCLPGHRVADTWRRIPWNGCWKFPRNGLVQSPWNDDDDDVEKQGRVFGAIVVCVYMCTVIVSPVLRQCGN